MIDELVSNIVGGEEEAWLILQDYLKESGYQGKYGKYFYTPKLRHGEAEYNQYSLIEENISIRIFGVGFDKTFKMGDQIEVFSKKNPARRLVVGECRIDRMICYHKIGFAPVVLTQANRHTMIRALDRASGSSIGLRHFIHHNK